MSDLSLEEYMAHARLQFEEGLIRHAYRQLDDVWEGLVKRRSGQSAVRITMPPAFPFNPPAVVPLDLDLSAWSWHREVDGGLCLVAEDDHTDLWWADPDAFLAHVEDWFHQADLGWPDDRADLDLERYFVPSPDGRLVVYGDLQPVAAAYVRLHARPNDVLELTGRGVRPGGSRRIARDRWGYVADLGGLTSPPRTWHEMRALIGDEVAERVERATVDTLIVTYLRGDHQGAAVLDVRRSKEGIVLRRLRSGPNTLASTRARAGRSADVLAGKHVAILGIGAIGSFLADALVRAGVGRLTLVDHDVIKPGNLVRHLVGPSAIGMPKPLAVREDLCRRLPILPGQIEIEQADACEPTLVTRLLHDCDLVMNATADFSVSALLRAAALASHRHALSICVQNAGLTLRLDVLPPIRDGALPNSARLDGGPPYFEAGCGSPISPTPPQAVIEAAAVAARHAVGYLTGTPLHPSGEVREMTGVQL